MNTFVEVRMIVNILSSCCLPFVEYIRFYLNDEYRLKEFDMFDELFRYNNLSNLHRIGVLCDVSNYVEGVDDPLDGVSESVTPIIPPKEPEVIKPEPEVTKPEPEVTKSESEVTQTEPEVAQTEPVKPVVVARNEFDKTIESKVDEAEKVANATAPVKDDKPIESDKSCTVDNQIIRDHVSTLPESVSQPSISESISKAETQKTASVDDNTILDEALNTFFPEENKPESMKTTSESRDRLLDEMLDGMNVSTDIKTAAIPIKNESSKPLVKEEVKSEPTVDPKLNSVVKTDSEDKELELLSPKSSISQSSSPKPVSSQNVSSGPASTKPSIPQPTSPKRIVSEPSSPKTMRQPSIAKPLPIIIPPKQKPIPNSFLINETKDSHIGLIDYSLKISSSLGQENYIDYLKVVLSYECLSDNRLGNIKSSGNCHFVFKNETYTIPFQESNRTEDYLDAIVTQLGQHGIFVPSNGLVVRHDKEEISRNLMKSLKKRSFFSLLVTSPYILPSSADKDLYILHDISGIDKFTEEAKSGELIGYKKIAFYCRID